MNPELLRGKREAVWGFESFLKGEAMPPWPLEVFVEVSNLCNMKCAMCGTFSAASPAKHQNMAMDERGFYDSETFNAATASVLRHALVVHAFGYGEPTLHPQFREFIEYLSSFGVLVDFFTNAMKLDTGLADFLVTSGIGVVCVSMSGATADDYESLYTGGKYETVMRGIRNLAEAKQRHGSRYPVIQINSIGYDHHIAKIEAFVEQMASVGANHIFVKRASPDVKLLNDHISICRPWVEGQLLARARQRARALGIGFDSSVYESSTVRSEEEWELAKARLLRDKQQTHVTAWHPHVPLSELAGYSKKIELFPMLESYKMQIEPSPMDVPESEVEASLALFRPEQPVTPCMEPFKTMYIRQTGDVKPCCFALHEAPLGDVVKHSAEEVWRGAGFTGTRNAILEGKYPRKVCGTCIENHHAPPGHQIGNLIVSYGLWFRERYRQEFLDAADARRLQFAPGNREAVRRWGKETSSEVVPKVEGALPRIGSAALWNIEHIAGMLLPPPGATIDLRDALGDAACIDIDGWAVDAEAQSSAGGIEVVVDGTAYPAQYGASRPDVVEAFRLGAYDKAGFWCQIPAEAFQPGLHSIALRVIAQDSRGYYATPTRAIRRA
jgi:MoaA/NifB/PqqE/SkfB family radical SAM enzyme